jgi:D-xylose transport system permease protein
MRREEAGVDMVLSIRRNIRANITKYALVLELLVIFCLFQWLTDGLFASSSNMTNLLMQGCTFAIIGIGMVPVMVAGHIDLSAGAVLGFLATVAATMEIKWHLNPILAIFLTLVCGILIGCWNGFWIAYRRIPAFIATLAGQLVFKGLTLWLGGGAGIGPMSDTFSALGRSYLPSLFFKNDVSMLCMAAIVVIAITVVFRRRASKRKYRLEVPPLRNDILKLVIIVSGVLAVGSVLHKYRGIPYAIVLLLILAAIVTFICANTQFGRSVYAIGGNREASKLSGINIERTNFKIFVFMGLITAIAAVFFLGRVGQATALTGQNFEFSAITGCIVGGTSTLGGSGTIVGAIIGTIMMASLDNGMSLLNLGNTYQFVAKGLVLILAVALDVASKGKE